MAFTLLWYINVDICGGITIFELVLRLVNYWLLYRFRGKPAREAKAKAAREPNVEAFQKFVDEHPEGNDNVAEFCAGFIRGHPEYKEKFAEAMDAIEEK